MIISHSHIKGFINAPSSKSYGQRACAAALLKSGKSILKNYGNSNDELAALNVIKELGAEVLTHENYVEINSSFNKNKIFGSKFFVEESGLSLRLFTTICCLLNYPIEINGTGSLINRPIDFFEKTLPQLGVKINTTLGKLPLNVCGSLNFRDIEIDGSQSSQFLSGLIMAFSYLNMNLENDKTATIFVKDLKSKPYINVTIDVLKDFGLPVPINNNYESFSFLNKSNIQNSNEIIYNIEGDWSNAAMLLVAGAIGGEIKVGNLNTTSKQADIKILEVLKQVGCVVNIKDDFVEIKTKAELNTFEFDATNCPDLFPPLVALAAHCKGISIIKGANRLIHKESNRALTLQKEFGKLGVEILLENDRMKVVGTNKILSANVNSHNDHRIAMALTIAAIKSEGNIIIENANAINKSYPNFFIDMMSIGLEAKS